MEKGYSEQCGRKNAACSQENMSELAVSGSMTRAAV